MIRPPVLVLILLLAASTVSGTVREPDVYLVGVGDRPPLESGQAYELLIEIRVREGVSFSGASAISGPGRPRLELESQTDRAQGEQVEGYSRHFFTVRGIHEAGNDPRIEVVVDGVSEELELDLFEGEDRTVASERPPYEPPRLALSGLDPPALSEDLEGVQAPLARAARTVRVSGRLTIEVRQDDASPIEVQGIDGVTVVLKEPRSLIDDYVHGAAVTDANGDFSFGATIDGTKFLYLQLQTQNGSAVNVGNGTFFSTYEQWIWSDREFSGTTIEVGTQHFGLDHRMNPPLFMASTITRAHRWFRAHGIEPGRVSVHYPDDSEDVSFYTTNLGSEGIHLTTNAGRSGGTLLHEYGHHWVRSRASANFGGYCNGICDADDDCGHCWWCVENESVAWSEGYANFISYLMAKEHLDTYGWELPSAYQLESIGTCGDPPRYDPPSMTEGYLGTLCRDLVDLDNENDLAIDSDFADRSNLDPVLLMRVAMEGRATTPYDFVRDLHEELLARPGTTRADLRNFWSTVRNNGLADDAIAPTAPTLVSSPTHPIGTPSPSAQPSFFFSGATDDYTGVQGYYVDIHTSSRAPAAGGAYLEVGGEVWPTPLAPGTWYANVRAVDGAGNQSAGWISYGPFTVANPVSIDLRPTTDLFWEGPLIVRNTPDASPGAVGWQPNLLPGDMYINLLIVNDSPGSATVDEHAVVFELDGVEIHREVIAAGNVLPGQLFQLVNLGPFTLPPGRHTIVARVDGSGAISELVEANNAAAVIVVADPAPLTPGNFLGSPPVPVTLPATGSPFGGQDVLGFNPRNQGAVVFTPSSRYTVVSARTRGSESKLNLIAYEPHTNPFTGLETIVGRVASLPDYGLFTHMVIDRDLFPSATVEIGAACGPTAGCPEYEIVATSAFSMPLAATTKTVLNPVLAEDLDVLAIEFDIDASSVGYLRATLEAEFSRAPNTKRLQAFWVAPGEPVPFTNSDEPSLQTEGREIATRTLDVPFAGKYLLVIMKSPFYSVGPVSVNARLELERIPRPELVLPEVDPIWDFGLIPLPAQSQDDTLSFPTELLGDVSSTFVNFSLMNVGDVDVPLAPVNVLFEGEPLLQLELGPIPAGGRVEYRSPFPINVPAGRRALAVNIDPDGLVDEFDKSNNTFAVQFGWRGPNIFSQAITRPSPPDPNLYVGEIRELIQTTRGADGEIGETEFVTRWSPNCDGLRLEPALLRATSGTWVGAAIAPTTAENHDLRLFDGTLAPAIAFTQSLATSSWGIGETDFVLVSGAPDQSFDLGVYATNGDDPYDAYGVRSVFLGSPPEGSSNHGVHSMASGELLELFEFQLEPGTYTIQLTNQSAVHLGMSVHAPLSRDLTPYHGKDELLEQSPNGWENGPGQGQTTMFVVEEGEQGRWCIAVWRQTYADRALGAFFGLDVSAQLDAPATVRVDGFLDPTAYGYAIVTQTIGTAFGDNTEPRLDLANGSELDGVYATIADDKLYLMFTGNLESNGNDLEVFLDTRPGGMNRLDGGLGDVPSGALARMGDDGSGNGLTFDPQFAADYYVTVGGSRRGFDGTTDPYLLDVEMAEIGEGGVVGRRLGSTFAAQNGRLYGSGAGEIASGSLLVNPSFEEPASVGPEYFGAGDGWESFGGGVYTVTTAFAPPNSGAQSLKLFGVCCSGVFQQFPTAPGEAWAGSVWIYNNPDDPLSGGQVAAVNIEWIQSDGVSQSAIVPFVSNGSTTAESPQGIWTRQTIRGQAPDDAAFARFVLITGDFAPGGAGGAPFFDDATFLRETPGPAETADPNPFGVLAAINNANLGGVGAGTGADDGSGVTTGIEFGIPLAALGDPQGCVRVSAFINGAEHDFVSNQVLGPLPVGTNFLGEPRSVDFGALAGNQFFEICPDGVVAVDDTPTRPHQRVVFHEPTPNPFNPRTTLAFTLTESGPVRLSIYTASGRRIRELVAGTVLSTARHEVSWDGVDGSGQVVASGVYFARLEAHGTTLTRRMVLLK